MKKNMIADVFGYVVYWQSEQFEKDRDTLFFLHGLTADHTMFDRQIEFFSKDYNIITWDAPAHGESRPYMKFTYENAAKAVKNILDDCGVDKVILIGQSMGGFISQSVISRYPERVKGFVAIDSTPYGDYYSKSDMWWLRQIEWMAKLYPDKILRWAMANQCCVTKHGRKNMADMLACYDKNELCHLMGIGFSGFLADNQELEIKCPVLLLLGEKDHTGYVKAYNKEWTKRTGFPLKIIKDAAHNANVDQPDVVNRLIKEFIDENC